MKSLAIAGILAIGLSGSAIINNMNAIDKENKQIQAQKILDTKNGILLAIQL